MASSKSTKVPKDWQEYYASITAISDEVCRKHLDNEYMELARCALAALCRKRPSPLVSGHKQVWACAVVYALGQVNFLSDRSSLPCMSMAELCAAFEVAGSTAANKAKIVRDLLGMHQFDPTWSLPSLVEQSPLTWTLSVKKPLPADAGGRARSKDGHGRTGKPPVAPPACGCRHSRSRSRAQQAEYLPQVGECARHRHVGKSEGLHVDGVFDG